MSKNVMERSFSEGRFGSTGTKKPPLFHLFGPKGSLPTPTGPEGEKRPADVIGNAVKVKHIATGEEMEDLPVNDGKNPAAKALGAKGGTARVKSMMPERRAEIAKKAATKRWERS